MKSSSQSKPANDFEIDDLGVVVCSHAAAVEHLEATALAVRQANTLVDRGVIPEEDRDRAMAAILALTTAGGPYGGGRVARAVRAIVGVLPLAPVAEKMRRMALARTIRANRGARLGTKLEWIRLRIALQGIDPTLGKITKAAWEECRDQSDHRFAARLCVKFGTFSDRNLDRSFAAFERASRETSRKPRSRAKK